MKLPLRHLPIAFALCVVGVACALQPVVAADYFDQYGLVAGSPTIDVGVQPLGIPSGMISSVMQRDRLLQSALVALKQPLKMHAFRRGADMVGLLADHRLEAGLLGDMPTILAASAHPVWVAGLVKQTSTALVAVGDPQIRSLAGKRIGYVPLSSAHNTLLQGLASAGLVEADVQLVALRVDDMPDALARGDIDAFAAWEPAPSIALARSEKTRVVFRGLSADYFVIDRDFEQRSPEAARIVVAGFVRAIEWMRASQKNVETAARWVLADAQAFGGKPPVAAVPQIVAITRREILGVPSAPVVVRVPGSAPPLKVEFEFLKKLGKLPQGGSWEQVVDAFRYDGLSRVMSESRKYQVRVFDYAP